MSVFKDKHIELCDLWHEAFNNYKWFRDLIEKNGWTEDDGVALGEYYGMMCGYAIAEERVFETTTLWDEFHEYEDKNGISTRKKDFNKNGS